MYVLFSNIRLVVDDSLQWRVDLVSYNSPELPWHVHDILDRFKNEKIIFIANNPYFKKSILKHKVKRLIIRKNVGMDFGAWKEALKFVPKGEDVLLINDSIFGFTDPEDFFRQSVYYDFFGLSYNAHSHRSQDAHVQTMMVMVKAHVVESKAFKNFFREYDHTATDKEYVIRHGEMGFTKAMKKGGFSPGWMSEFKSWIAKEYHEAGSPFLKIKHNEGIYNAITRTKLNKKTDPKIDVVYPLGSGSAWDDNELRFSLRSLERHLIGFRNIIIVGPRKPSWIDTTKIVWLWCDDPLKNNVDGNIIRKVLKACSYSWISDKFLFINDDHLILRDLKIENLANYHKGDLIKNHERLRDIGNTWIQRAIATGKKLQSEEKPTIHYDCHTPVLIDKKKFPAIISQYDYDQGIGYVIKSLYLNNMKRVFPKHYGGFKVLLKDRMYRYVEIVKMLENAWFMSYQDTSLNGALMMWLKDRFPEKSIFEKETFTENGNMDIISWLNNPVDYWAGVKLFEMNSRNINLKKLFQIGDRPKTRMKLKYQLEKILEK